MLKSYKITHEPDDGTTSSNDIQCNDLLLSYDWHGEMLRLFTVLSFKGCPLDLKLFHCQDQELQQEALNTNAWGGLYGIRFFRFFFFSLWKYKAKQFPVFRMD